MSNQQANDKRYFNLHLEGFANLYDARWISPKPGQSFDPFLQVRAAYLQGKADNADPLFVDLKVTGRTAKRIIEHFLESISDRDQKVSAVVKAGDIRLEPKLHQGEPRVFVGARLLSVKYLKVNGETIELEPFAQADSAEAGKRGQVANLADYSQRADQQNQVAPAGGSSNHRPLKVTLDPNDPSFEQRKAELKAQGYRWDGGSRQWVLPEASQGQGSAQSDSRPMTVKLDPNDPNFEQRKAALKADGYRWDGRNLVWTLAPRAQASA